MPAASYTHDLTDWIADTDTAAWGELLNAIAGGAPDEVDTESALQGANSCSQITNATTLCSMCRIMAAPVSLAAGQVFLVWHGHGVATALNTYALGGLRLAVATDLNNYKAWSIGGNDVAPFPYAKWVNNPVDPTVTADYTTGVPPVGGALISGVGSMCLLTAAVARGQPHIVDIIRYGRAEARINGGDLANGYATFAGFAAQNDTTANRWGLVQATTGGYQWKGLMTLGYTSAVDFRDSNVSVFIQDCRKVSSTFNKIEIRQALSRVDWTNVSFINVAPNTNASKGSLEVIDNADVNLQTCSFTDMGTFSFKAATGALSCTFRRCGQITAPGSDLRGSIVDSYTGAADTSAVVWDVATDTDGLLNTMGFTKGANAHHAIELGTTSPTSVTLRGISFSGFNAANAANDSVLHVKRITGTVTINTVGCTGTVSYKSDGATVVIVADPATVSVNVKTVAGANLQNARVLLKAATGGPLPFDATVTITNAAAVATVAHTAHGMLTNDQVVIKGASLQANNGIFTIIVVTANTYTYTMGSAPGSNPTGTIKSTFVAISGLTDASGNISTSRVFPAAQPVNGWVRYGASPFYKPAALGGSISATTGYSTNALMVDDV